MSLDSVRLAGLRVLAVSPTPTHPTIAGNRSRYRALIDTLIAFGATVRLIHINHEQGDSAAMRAHWGVDNVAEFPFVHPVQRHARWNRFAERCRGRGIPLRERNDVDDWCDRGNVPRFREEVARFAPHAVLMAYYWNSRLLDGLGANVLRVLDAHDVFTDRNQRMERAGIPQRWYSVSRKQEQRGLNRFDVILANQQHEAEFYRTLTDVNVVTVGHTGAELDSGAPSPHPNLLMVGSGNAVNVDGLQWFLGAVWPRISEAYPAARLRIAGGVCAHVSAACNIELLGIVDDLAPVYADTAVVINPLRGGTGMKQKSVEALAAGRVVVSTGAAALGLEDAIGRGLIVAEDADHMAKIVNELLDRRDELAQLSNAASQFSAWWNERSRKTYLQIFQTIVDGPDFPSSLRRG